MNAGIAAVVVAYGSEETIDACLARLRAARDVAEVRVVDNASRDSTLEIVQRHAVADPRVRFIANPDNPGFAVACNQGAAASSAPWLAFVNPDCLVEIDTLARLRDTAVGLGGALVGAVLRGEDGVADPAARRRDPDFAAMLRSRAARVLAVPGDPARPVQPVDAVSGALMVLPRALFDRVGGFDPGYRLHAEDLDLCRRVRQAGAGVAIDNTVEVLHVRGVSSRARPLFVEWHKHRGLWRYFRRFEAARRGAFVRGAVFAMIWGHFPLALLRAAVRRR
ncbi:glycosyltransferase family 2 protein [Thermomonas sp.]|uniref:glycosyltransferase family 2 protein n=1 Tax=Thermomonas sp. TaxID=1971895 RepID=UPI00391BF92E